MIDINKGISDLEESFGRRLTDEEKFNIALFGEFMNNTFWDNTKQNASDPKPEPLPKEEIKPMDIGEVIDGLNYCLSTGKCIGCANSEGRMVATCRPLVENALRHLKDISALRIEELRRARHKFEEVLNNSYISEHYSHESMQFMYYSKGIRDACWAIDKMIKELGEDNETV